MSNLNEVASMAENIAAQVAAETENNETANTAPEAVTEETPTPTEAAPTAPKGKKGKKGQPKTNPDREAFEAAQMKAAELRREAEAKQRELDKCLEVLKSKKRLADHRAKFIETLGQLDEAEKLLTPEEFESKRMKLKIYELNDYGREDGFAVSITNSDLIMEFVAMLKDKINIKIEELETELVK
jgi:hypothetical protein